MTVQEAYKQLLLQLYELYDNREAANIADLVIEHVTGQTRIDRIVNKQMPVSVESQEMLARYTHQLLLHKPVQYVLHEAWFAGMKLYVDENVLIPRPETEELVEWVTEIQLPVTGHQVPVVEKNTIQAPATGNLQPVTILDIGTGSGCIPIALKRKFPEWDVHALDISPGAIEVAKKNAQLQQTPITFYITDILNEAVWKQMPMFDAIVSNPPYIRLGEEAEMQMNVTRYEPRKALFVPDDHALLFYEAIANFALLHLREIGSIYFEINENLGQEVCAMLAAKGFGDIQLRKDLQGKDRMVKATSPT